MDASKEVILRRDLVLFGFTVVAFYTPAEHRLLGDLPTHFVDFNIFQIEGEGKRNGEVLLHKRDAKSWPDPVSDIDSAEVFAHGRVKWDGCSDWHFDEQDRLMLHGCSRQDLVNLGLVLAVCWDMAAEIIGPRFSGVK